MAEGGFDPCECICTHEYAMRRLINLVSHETEVLSPSLEILGEKLDFASCIPGMQHVVKKYLLKLKKRSKDKMFESNSK